MASETAGRAARGSFSCGCGVWGHTYQCGANARTEAARLSARVAELERWCENTKSTGVERDRAVKRAEETEAQLSAALAEVARLRLKADVQLGVPCPFCAGPSYATRAGDQWFMLCQSAVCGAAGPNHSSEDEAVRVWAAIRVARDR